MDRYTTILTKTSTSFISSTNAQKIEPLESDFYFAVEVDGFFLLIMTVILAVSQLIK